MSAAEFLGTAPRITPIRSKDCARPGGRTDASHHHEQRLLRLDRTEIRRGDGAQLRYLGLEAAEGVRAGGIHGRRGRFSCCRMKGRDLDKYQTRGESRNKGHDGGRYRDSERQHPITSARPLQLGSKRRSRRNGQGAFGGRPSLSQKRGTPAPMCTTNTPADPGGRLVIASHRGSNALADTSATRGGQLRGQGRRCRSLAAYSRSIFDCGITCSCRIRREVPGVARGTLRRAR